MGGQLKNLFIKTNLDRHFDAVWRKRNFQAL